MRGIAVLLQIVKDNVTIAQRKNSGLCDVVRELYYDRDLKLITLAERRVLWDYIDQNRPFLNETYRRMTSDDWRFYWERGDVKPRIKWLDKHIKKHS